MVRSRLRTFFCSNAENASMSALSPLEPTLPLLPTTRWRARARNIFPLRN